jgi:hypothetical protein
VASDWFQLDYSPGGGYVRLTIPMSTRKDIPVEDAHRSAFGVRHPPEGQLAGKPALNLCFLDIGLAIEDRGQRRQRLFQIRLGPAREIDRHVGGRGQGQEDDATHDERE